MKKNYKVHSFNGIIGFVLLLYYCFTKKIIHYKGCCK